MRTIFWIVLLSIVFFSLTTYSWAVDYKVLLPYLPESLGDLKASSEPEGQNIQHPDKQTLSVSRTYGKGDQQVRLSILYRNVGMETPKRDQSEPFTMESSEGFIKIFRLQGFETIHTYEKAGEDCRMHIHLGGKTIVTLQGKTRDAGKDFLYMASQLPLSRLSTLLP